MPNPEEMVIEQYEFRDPVHGLITLNRAERNLIDSEPFQRLRFIRQLGTSYKVYHGAEHTRFGHSIGVMHLVGKALDALYSKWLKNELDEKEFKRLRQTARIAGLLHDIGHGPFSHAGEGKKYDLYPDLIDVNGQAGRGHEVYSRLVIRDLLGPQIEEDFHHHDIKIGEVLSLLLGVPHEKKFRFVCDLISGQLDTDKMDYLLRDSLYCGVKYGTYDTYKLIECLAVYKAPSDDWQLGISSDGIHVVEEFIFARYWMFLQVYFHKTRRIYDYYLAKFLKEQLPGGRYPTDLQQYLEFIDNKILDWIWTRKNHNPWAKGLYGRPPLKEAFVSKPHVDKTGETTELDHIAWVINEFEKQKNPGITSHVDQAKGSAAKSLIDFKTFVEESQGDEEYKLPAYPVINKYTLKVNPIQDISIPIKSISDKPINILRVYTDKIHVEEVRTTCERLYYDEYPKYLKEIEVARRTLEQAEEMKAKGRKLYE